MIWIRSVAFVLVSILTTLCFLVLYPMILAPMRAGWAVLRVYIGAEVFWLRVICGIRYQVTGLENLPDGPCILASRHEAMWETIFLPWLLDNPAVFLKREILTYPVAGPVARKLDYIGVDRTGDLDSARQSFDKARRLTRAGRSVLIFPSGTRDPEHRTRVQTGVALLYRQVSLPCVPIILNSGEHWLYGSWLRRPGVIKVEILPAIPEALTTRDFMDRLARDISRPVSPGRSMPLSRVRGEGRDGDPVEDRPKG